MSYTKDQNVIDRDQLFYKQDGACYYCKQPMRLIKNNIHSLFNMPLPDDAATLEHIYSKHDIRRYAKIGKLYYKQKGKWTVCCCYKCNNGRGSLEAKLCNSWPPGYKKHVFDIRILINPTFITKKQLFHLVFGNFSGIM